MNTYISTLPTGSSAGGYSPRRLVLLGSTGSIGQSAIKVIQEHPDRFMVLGLAGARNINLLAAQAADLRPQYLAVLNKAGATELKAKLPAGYSPVIWTGSEGYKRMASLTEAQMVLSAIVGAAGLEPTYAAVRQGKIVALANKESLVLAGNLIRKTCRETGAVILPVDSEHNALFQAMAGHEGKGVRKLLLTASGGPFRGKTKEFLSTVTPDQALRHPNWSMGAKITIDSATLMNKGLEVIEAYHLYGMPPEQIDVVVHPQSIVHSLVEYHDGSLLAHLGPPDMRLAISYCLGYPERLPLSLTPVDLVKLGSLSFEAPNLKVFPCLRLAKEALAAGPSAPVVLNAANEIAVDLFLRGKIGFLDIPRIITEALEGHSATPLDTVDDILALDRETRATVCRSHGA